MGRILIVDDEPQACAMMARLVKHFGHDSVCRLGGQEALDYIRETPIDLLILDVMMPGMDGMQVLRRLRDDPQTASIPVVMFSAVADRNFIEDALRKGATDYWVKASFDFKMLKERLDQLLPGADASGAA
jgi:CheY-like chemotaxis protein